MGDGEATGTFVTAPVRLEGTLTFVVFGDHGTGGPDSAKPPEGRNLYGWVMGERRADVFLTYCTNAVLARKEVPALQVVSIPDALAVGADYGLIVRKDAPAEAGRLALFILSPAGQAILADYGFVATAVPSSAK